MKLLRDTHTFLWHSLGSPQISASATALLVDPANELLLSMGTVWEIAIKVGLKKLVLWLTNRRTRREIEVRTSLRLGGSSTVKREGVWRLNRGVSRFAR
ncbi:MAG: type II toxin-antitoxin system VapC family toxin [Planctomycetales bacterium]